MLIGILAIGEADVLLFARGAEPLLIEESVDQSNTEQCRLCPGVRAPIRAESRPRLRS